MEIASGNTKQYIQWVTFVTSRQPVFQNCKETLGMIQIWHPWKLLNFYDRPPTLSIYVQTSSAPTSLSLLSANDKQSFNKDDYHMKPGPSFRWAFRFSINSLVLRGFPLTSFNLAEASLPASSSLYTLLCAVVQKYHKISRNL